MFSILRKNKKLIPPWIFIRLRLLLLIVLDIVSKKIFSLINKGFFNAANNINYLILLIIWINVSYVNGKYKLVNHKSKFSIEKIFYNPILTSSFITSFVYSLLPYFLSIKEVSLEKIPEFIYIIILLLFLSAFNGYLVNSFYFKNKVKNNTWYIYGSKIEQEFIFNFLRKSDKRSNHIFKLYDKKSFDMNFKNNSIIIKNFNSLPELDKLKIQNLINKKIKVLSLTEWVEIYMNRIPIEIMEFDKTINHRFFSHIKANSFQLIIKRLLDILFSSFLLLISSPIIIISILIIWFQEFEKVLYDQKRTGLGGKEIKIYKLRTMQINSEQEGLSWALKDDPRITKFGKFLRKSRIDELPQLFNVIKGDMTLIGPRPERPEIDKELIQIIPNYFNRYSIKPGLSGWAQVNYNYAANIEEVKNKLSYDLFYIKIIQYYLIY